MTHKRAIDAAATPDRTASITPSDSATFDICQGFYIGGTGNLTVTKPDGTDQPFANVPAGKTLWVQAKAVKATGTTATGIVAMYL